MKKPYNNLYIIFLVIIFGFIFIDNLEKSIKNDNWNFFILIFLVLLILYIYIYFPKYILYLVILVSFINFSNYLRRLSIDNIFKWAPHIIIFFCLIFDYLFGKYKNLSKIKNMRIVYWWIIMATILIIISSVLNSVPYFIILVGSIQIFLPISVLLMVINRNLEKTDYVRLLDFIYFIGLLQLPVTVVQKVYWGGGDLVTGTSSTVGGLVFCQIFCILILLNKWINLKNTSQFKLICGFIILIVPLILSDAVAGWIVLFISLLIFAMLNIFHFRRVAISAIIFVPLIIYSFEIFGNTFYDFRGFNAKTNLSSISNFYEYYFGGDSFRSKTTKSGELKYGASIAFVYDLISKDPLSLLFGLGPGNLSESSLGGGSGLIYKEYSVLGLDRNMVSVVLGELGILGLLLVVLYFSLFLKKSDNYENNISNRSLYISLLALIFMLSFYQNPLRIPSMLFAITFVFLSNNSFNRN